MTEATSGEVRIGKRERGAGRRWVWLSVALGLTALVTGATGYDRWANELPPIPPASSSLPFPNGYYGLRAALDAIDQTARSQRSSPRLRGLDPLDKTNSIERADSKTLDQTLALYLPHLKRLRAAIRLSCVSPHPGLTSRGIILSPRIARLFEGEARLKRGRGQWAESMSDCLDAVELGARIGPGLSLIDHHRGRECVRVGLDGAHSVVTRLSESQARAAGRRVDLLHTQLSSYAEALRDERTRALGLTAAVLSDPDYFAAVERAGDASGWERVWLRWKHRLRPKRETYLLLARYFEAAIRRAELPYPDMHQTPAPPVPSSPYSTDPVDDASAFAEIERGLRLLRLELALQEHFRRTGKHLAPADYKQLGLSPETLIDPLDGSPVTTRV